ncbi:MAG: hypothetical protein ABIW82_06540 [Dokdonella sp.]
MVGLQNHSGTDDIPLGIECTRCIDALGDRRHRDIRERPALKVDALERAGVRNIRRSGDADKRCAVGASKTMPPETCARLRPGDRAGGKIEFCETRTGFDDDRSVDDIRRERGSAIRERLAPAILARGPIDAAHGVRRQHDRLGQIAVAHQGFCVCCNGIRPQQRPAHSVQRAHIGRRANVDVPAADAEQRTASGERCIDAPLADAICVDLEGTKSAYESVFLTPGCHRHVKIALAIRGQTAVANGIEVCIEQPLPYDATIRCIKQGEA